LPHPIQLKNVNIVELFCRANQPPTDSIEVGDDSITIASRRTNYIEEENTIVVGLLLEIGMEDEPKTPFSMKVELFGEFSVEEERFSKDDLPHWAAHNAPFILFPYLREQVYSLSLRCGFPPLILPLVTIPQRTVKKHSKKEETQPTD